MLALHSSWRAERALRIGTPATLALSITLHNAFQLGLMTPVTSAAGLHLRRINSNHLAISSVVC
jgi:hypothetical protein